jgi:ABC-2 type transport system ATP-binding protein
MTAAIQTIDLMKRYGSKTAVKGLNLAVEQGELFALLGVNGAGKTTTIKMLTCLSRPTGGDALILGNSIVTAPEAVKPTLNVSPQETAVARQLSVRENLEFMARVYGSDTRAAGQAASEKLSTFGLTDVSDERAGRLSGGMQRRLSLAMALISNPQILFLDEPTLGLDVLARRELWANIQKLRGQITIVLTTHYMEEAEALSDRIGVMAAGDLKAIGTAAALMAETGTPTLEDAFVAYASEAGRLS